MRLSTGLISACFWFKLEGFIILRSSTKKYLVKRKANVLHRFLKCSYHVIFNRPVRWDLNVRIMNWVALESKNIGLQNYARMQCIKRTSTVRISGKVNKPIPKIVFRYGKLTGRSRSFLKQKSSC